MIITIKLYLYIMIQFHLHNSKWQI